MTTAVSYTIPELLDRNAEKYGDQIANREKEFGIWQSWTWKEVQNQVEEIALGYLALGIKEGDHIAVLGRNRPKLYWSMVAAQRIGAVPVPIYQDAVGDEIGYVLGHCEAVLAIAGDQEQVDKILEQQDKCKSLEQIIYLDPRGLRNYDHSRLHSFASLHDAVDQNRKKYEMELQARQEKINPEKICVILYTSGTTGNPKGVVLSHANIISASRDSSEFDSLSQKETVLAYLPMAWVGDFIFSIGQAYWNGFCVNCPESSQTMMHDLREIGPSYFFAPPRVFESLLTTCMIRIEDAGKIKRSMFQYFMKHARKVGVPIMTGEKISPTESLIYRIGEILVYGPLRNVLGLSRVRVGYTAGEAIGPEIFDFYRSIGINLKQLYGQTEASVFITSQPDGEVEADSVGVPGQGVELRIDDRGEIFYRSPGTFIEYYKNPEATKSTKDKDGWVATGDAGFIDESNGHLKIIDRAKDVGKMANGKLFAPKYVENKLKFFPDILETVVFGNNREYCTAMVNIDLVSVGNWAERNNVVYSSYQELAGHPEVYKIIQNYVRQVNEDLAGDEKLSGCIVKRFLVLHKELDADDGELTRTRKVRRGVIEDKYSDLVTALYDGSKEIHTTSEVTYEDGRKGFISATLKILDV
ncbi:MAG: long-chain fatty acid--CoA ligase [Rhodobacteraceae bacterium]|nr:long-chain fatty acid--CoA ligase [Paracoccaceae bacterium]MYJ86906.1 long-chain fatty acid--CoA ligase [Paracoccaceae bacterium]